MRIAIAINARTTCVWYAFFFVSTPSQLERIYSHRFDADVKYRDPVWQVLVREFFQRMIPSTATVLDLGCGYGFFINHVECGVKYAMDLNANARGRLRPDVRFLEMDCSTPWPLEPGSLDVVFSSNFLEHLPDKTRVEQTLYEAYRCLRPGGMIIAMGPNMRYVEGAYWDFWDHHVPITDRSLAELLILIGFHVEQVVPQFLPYTAVGKRQQPMFVVRSYLKLPWVWRFFGQQFLVVARKRA
ncbi:MAG: class I SAM-dependent methyltransferase [Terriglobia bacterium]|nr:MAG: class I SAM-dependent methyltransferase [Terriglobia bacterium]